MLTFYKIDSVYKLTNTYKQIKKSITSNTNKIIEITKQLNELRWPSLIVNESFKITSSYLMDEHDIPKDVCNYVIKQYIK